MQCLENVACSGNGLYEGTGPLLPRSRHCGWELRGLADSQGWSACPGLAPRLLACFSLRLGSPSTYSTDELQPGLERCLQKPQS